jgi:hypothetical protein
MKNLTEEKLLQIGFDKVVVTAEESGDNEFFYFVKQLGDEYDPELISDGSDEITDGLFSVELFDQNGFGYCENDVEVNELITVLSKRKN